MPLANLIFFLAPLLAQCAPLLKRTDLTQTVVHSSASYLNSASANDSYSSTTGLLTSVSETPAFLTSPSSFLQTTSTVAALDALKTPQPEIVLSSGGSEAVFIAPGSSDDSTSNDDASIQAARPLVMGYYPYWISGTLPPEQIDFTQYDWVDFAFLTLNQTFQLSFDDPSCPDLLRRTVAAAHARGKYVKASIGGWGGSQYFSSAVSTDSNRRVFVQEVIRVINLYVLDGIDFDWEYPGHEGLAGNQVNPADSTNYLLFLQLLRSSLAGKLKITAAASQTPFTGQDGQPMKDVFSFARVLDWVMVMNYDVWQSSPNPGPNAPLYDGCHNSSQPEANAASAVKQWNQAGFPLKQLVLGVPYYGYLSNSNATRLRTRASSPSVRLLADGGADEGSITFRNLLDQGAIAANSPSNGGRRTFTAAGGFYRYWDACSATPFLRSQTSRQIVAFDDPESIRMKGQFVKKMGLLGTNTWDLSGDTPQKDLVVALKDGFSSI